MESPRASKRRKISTNSQAQISSPLRSAKDDALPPSGPYSAGRTSRPTRTYGRSRKSYDSLRNDTSQLDSRDNGGAGEQASFVDSAYQSRTTSRTTPDEAEESSVVETPSRTLRSGKKAVSERKGQDRAGSTKKQAPTRETRSTRGSHAQVVLENGLQDDMLQSGDQRASRHLGQVDYDTIVVRGSSPLGAAIESQSERDSSSATRSSGRARRHTRKVQEIALEKPIRRRREGKGRQQGLKENHGEKVDKQDDQPKRKHYFTEAKTGKEKRTSQRLELIEGVGEKGQVEVEHRDEEEGVPTEDDQPTFGELLGIHESTASPAKRLRRGRNVESPQQKHTPLSFDTVLSPFQPASDQAHAEDPTQLDTQPAKISARRITNRLSRSRGNGLVQSEEQLEDSPSLPGKSSTSKTQTSPFKLLEDKLRKAKDAPKELEAIKTGILDYLTRKQRLPLHGLETEYQKVHQLIEQTVAAGEGNSLLLIGPRGCAKTNLVETAIANIRTTHQEDFHVVRLNGFIHTDDKLALKDIWRQLGREMEVENHATPSSYADNLTSLLALLSHPMEHEEDPSAMDVDSGIAAKSVIFVIDEFDLFTSHSRQTLLYNLFDIAQARKAPIAVLGLTTKVDVMDSLEKRVKSRFSHRYVYVSFPKSLHAFKEICKSALTARNDRRSFNEDSPPTPPKKPNSASLQAHWDAYIDDLFSTNPSLNYLCGKIYATTKSVPEFLSASLIPVLSLSPTTIPTGASFLSTPLEPPDSNLHLLPSLSELELSLLIAAARLDVILDTDTCNFNMAYDEYVRLAEKAKLISSASGASALGGASRTWGREVAMGAWERLVGVELLVPAAGGAGTGTDGGVGKGGKLWKVDVGLEEIGEVGVEMNSVMARWCREI